MNAARRLCAEMGVALCDCYDRWQAMKQAGIDTTALLANHINHPSRVMHGMFAGMLLDTMLMHTKIYGKSFAAPEWSGAAFCCCQHNISGQ